MLHTYVCHFLQSFHRSGPQLIALIFNVYSAFMFLLSKAQPKNALINPPPIQKCMQTFMRVRTYQWIRCMHNLTFFYNCIILELRSTTEQMLSLVNFKVARRYFERKKSTRPLKHDFIFSKTTLFQLRWLRVPSLLARGCLVGCLDLSYACILSPRLGKQKEVAHACC
jgi:hypothetical protein